MSDLHSLHRVMWLGGAVIVGGSLAYGQDLGGGQPIEIPTTQIFIGLGVSAAIAYLVVLLIKRSGAGTSVNRGIFSAFLSKADAEVQIRVLESKRLSPQVNVVLISALGRRFLVSVSESHCCVLRDETITGDERIEGSGVPNG